MNTCGDSTQLLHHMVGSIRSVFPLVQMSFFFKLSRVNESSEAEPLMEYSSTVSVLDNATKKRTYGLTDRPELTGVSFECSSDACARRNLICISIDRKMWIILWHVCSKQELWSQRNSRC
jgi:hypothetical protein